MAQPRYRPIPDERPPVREKVLVAGRKRPLFAGAVLVVAALALAACGSSTPSSTGKKKSVSSTSTTMAHHHGSAVSLSALESRLSSGETSTFSAAYHIHGDFNGKPETGTFTIAHNGGKSLVSGDVSGSIFEEIVNGKTSSLCISTGGKWECLAGNYAKAIKAEVAVYTKEYTNKGVLALARQAAMEKDYDVTTSSKTVGGLSSQCWAYHTHLDNATYSFCVGPSGALTEAMGSTTAGKWTMTLARYSKTVAASKFTPPAHATKIGG